jgi:hypothetical protein
MKKKLVYFELFIIITIIIFPLLRVYNIETSIADLGFYSSSIKHINSEWQRSFFGHIKPLEYLIAITFSKLPAYYIPYLLQVVNSFLILGACFLAKKHYGDFVYRFLLVNPFIWYYVIEGFHIDTFSLLFSMLFFIGLKKVDYKLIFISLLLLSVTKEIFAIQSIFYCLYILFLSWKNKDKRSFKITSFYFLILSLLTYLEIFKILPFFSMTDTSIVSNYYTTLHNFGQFNQYLISDTFYRKLLYLIIIFTTFIYAPFIRYEILIPALPIIAASILSNNPNHFTFTNHYTIGLVIPFTIAVYEVYGNKPYNNYILIAAAVLTFLISPSPMSRLFLSEKISRLNYKNYIPTDRNKIIKVAMDQYISINDSISSQNSVNYSENINRRIYILFPDGVFTPHLEPDYSILNFKNFQIYLQTGKSEKVFKYSYADIVILDLKRDIYNFDRGCKPVYGVCQDENQKRIFYENRDNLLEKYKLIFEYDGFEIYKLD